MLNPASLNDESELGSELGFLVTGGLVHVSSANQINKNLDNDEENQAKGSSHMKTLPFVTIPLAYSPVSENHVFSPHRSTRGLPQTGT